MERATFIILTAIIALGHAIRPPIIEGTEAALHEFPYQVSMQWNFNNGSRPRHFCSGSILNRKWILTAAHCKEQHSSDGWCEIVAGVNNIADEEAGAQRRNVSRFEQHPDYSAGMIKNDIGVILLSKAFNLNRNIKEITLAQPDAVFQQTHGKFAGWGSISKTMVNVFPDELMKIQISLRNRDKCQAMGSVDESQICAGGYRNVTGCTADSGGPLTVTVAGEQVQIGVLSYGEKPCLAREPVRSVPSTSLIARSSVSRPLATTLSPISTHGIRPLKLAAVYPRVLRISLNIRGSTPSRTRFFTNATPQGENVTRFLSSNAFSMFGGTRRCDAPNSNDAVDLQNDQPTHLVELDAEQFGQFRRASDQIELVQYLEVAVHPLEIVLQHDPAAVRFVPQARQLAKGMVRNAAV
uniref:Peptidase S1 domain-containing protein n=1 Tax=Anopheles farauti TaxID=69004 RepID=A0A182Q9G5_9DIPT